MVIFNNTRKKKFWKPMSSAENILSKWKHQHSSRARTLLLPHHQNFQDIKAFVSSLGRECSGKCFSAQDSGLSALLSDQSHCRTLPHLLWDLLNKDTEDFRIYNSPGPNSFKKDSYIYKDLLMRIGPLWEDAFEQLSSFSARSKTVSTLSFDLGITADGSVEAR